MNSCKPISPMQSYDLIVEHKSDQGTRLDRWLSSTLIEISRSQIQRLIDEGQVQINQTPCASKKVLLNIGDRISITVPNPKPLHLEPENIPLDVLFEDDHLIIINKAAGMVVHPAPGHATGTLVHALLYHCQIETPTGITTTLSGIGGTQRPGIIHRLDKDTTGAIVVAKTDQAHQHLQGQIAAKTARREYLGIVYGQPKEDSGTINQPIGRHVVHREKQAIIPEDQGGRYAITHWQVQERLGNYSLVHFQLETGRTHQIRVHAAWLGCPIMGDPLYSRSGKTLNVKTCGQALHACKLALDHPVTGEKIQAEAPWPDSFHKLLGKIKKKANESLSVFRPH
jgi:23S rRNA pseudouridine1911/1915/1917 synthase